MPRLAVNVEQLRMLLISEINPYKTFLVFFCSANRMKQQINLDDFYTAPWSPKTPQCGSEMKCDKKVRRAVLYCVNVHQLCVLPILYKNCAIWYT